MATESNSGFCHDDNLGSWMSRHAISFQSGAVNSTSEMIPMGTYFEGTTSTTGMIVPGKSGVNIINAAPSRLFQAGNSSVSPLLVDSIPGLNQDAFLANEWSAEEQNKLEEGLEKFKDETRIMKYIKIAATLRDKTVRDVAMRCRWLTRKRRKAEEHDAGRKMSCGKEKQVESSSKVTMSSVQPQNMASYPFLMNGVGLSDRISSDGLSGNAINLLEQNVQAFNQIRTNLSMYRLQDNLDLFRQTRNSLVTILTVMRNMPGIMSQMPPLPISINEDPANNILTGTTQSTTFSMPKEIHMKQEPRS